MDRRVKPLLVLAAGCAVLFGVLLAGTHWWDPGGSLDLLGLTGFMSANSGWVDGVTAKLMRLGDPLSVALITIVLAGLALARGRPRVALAVLMLIAATSVSSQALKALLNQTLEAPILGHVVGPDAFPSGHATAAMALALSAVLAAPRRARPAAALLGGLLALAVGASTVAQGAHLPSDVLGGYLLATAWTLALVAVLRGTDDRFRATNRWAVTVVGRASDRIAAVGLVAAAAGCTLAALLGGAAVLASDPAGAVDFAQAHTTSVAVGAAMASVAVALPTAMAALVRQA
jgi:membrane-associated phospholipid phosphatase